ncbi:MAG: GNAT family N-acetyltransferase [Deltaproteobacteria bacterium]|nr:GNAT family N-acetyltransferase [Deltaproteobacteria bacterium]
MRVEGASYQASKPVMEVREARASDREALNRIIENTENLTREEKDCAAELLDIYLSDSRQKDYFFIVAAEAQAATGYVCYGRTPLTDAVYDLYWILVAGEFRSRGIGRLLLERTEDLIKKQGARMLVAETSGLPAYESAHAFYKKTGFKEEARIKEFYKPGDDLITFVKRF